MKRIKSIISVIAANLVGLSFIAAQNMTPIAVNDNYTIFTNSGANYFDVQSNDSDDSPIIITGIVNGPSNGSVIVMNDDSLAYTPDSNFCGVDTLWYSLCDNGAPSLCDTAMVIITVAPGDADGDGLNDVYEQYYADSDGDGVYDTEDIDSDNDGIPDSVEAQVILGCVSNPRDTDGDGIPDHLDLDSDNDGISDLLEAGLEVYDLDKDGILENISALDYNGNGMPDVLEGLTLPDTDGDGVPNPYDLDSDNDGIADIVETANANADTNNDGYIGTGDSNTADSDNDGIADVVDDFNGPGDGSGNQSYANWDKDGDNLTNAHDLDSDNDGITDIVESGFGNNDSNNDGVVDGTDTDNDGIVNSSLLDNGTGFGGDPGSQNETLMDNDGDGVPNQFDLDSDNDGISDAIEAGFGLLDTDGNGMINGNDTDNDGIINATGLDTNNGLGADAGTQDESFWDSDGDGSINSEDLDSDNDGISDLVEGNYGALDIDDNGVLDGTDNDNDGVINVLGLDDNTVFGFDMASQSPLFHDFDNDSILDFLDLDADNDTVPDVYEAYLEDLDTDNDGRINGSDSDGDGIIDVAPIDQNGTYGGEVGSQNETLWDPDSDTFINSEDLDDDGDALTDHDEWDWNQDGVAPDDCDLDQLWNFLDTDECDLFIPEAFSPNNDGLNDFFDIDGLTVYPNNSLVVINRWGVKVFGAAPYNNDWYGTSDEWGGLGNNVLPIGTYFYVFDKGDGTDVISGFVYINH